MSGEHKDNGVGWGFVEVEDNLPLNVFDGGGSKPSNVEPASWGVEFLEESDPSRLALVLLLVVRLDLKVEVKSELLVSEGELFLDGVLGRSDDLHLSTSWVDCGVKLIGDDGGVWLLVVGDEVNLSRWRSALKLSWGNSHLENIGFGSGKKDSEWSFDNKVSLDSSLVFLSSEWNLEGDGSVRFPVVNWVYLSLDLHITRSDSIVFDGSLERDGDWHVEFVDDGETER